MSTQNLNLVLDKIQLALTSLGDKLGVGGKHLWMILIKQQYIHGFIALFWAIIGIILLGGTVKYIQGIIKRNKRENRSFFDFDDGTDDAGWFFIMIITGIIGMVLLIIGGISAVNHLVNPEYQALQSIIQMINPPKI